MKGILKYQKRSMLYRMLASYLVIVLIMLIISAFIFNHLIDMIGHEMTQKNQYVLEKFSKTVDQTLSGVMQLAAGLSGQSKIKKLRYVTEEVTAQNRYDAAQAIEVLNGYKVANPYIKNIYLYLSKANLFVTDSNSADDNLLYYMKYGAADGRENWDGLIRGEHHAQVMILPQSHETTLLYCQTIYVGADPGSLINVFVELDVNCIYDEINAVFAAENVSCCIYDGSGSISTGPVGADTAQSMIRTVMDNQDMSTLSMDGEEYFVTTRSSDHYDIEYFAYMPYYQYMKSLIALNKTVIACICILVALGFVMALSFTVMNYYPLNRLMNRLGKYPAAMARSGRDEFTVIDEIIHTIEDQNQAMLSRKKQVDEQYCNALLCDLIKGRTEYGRGAADELRANGECPFTEACYLFAVIQTDGADPVPGDADAAGVVRRLLGRLPVGERANARTVAIDGNILCLVNVSREGLPVMREGLMKACRAVLRALEEQSGIMAYIYLSGECASFRDIAAQYQNCLHMEDYKFFMSRERILFYDHIKAHSESEDTYLYSMNEEMKLTNHILNGEGAKAKAVTDAVRQYIVEGGISAGTAKCLLYDIIASIVKVYRQAESRYGVAGDVNFRKTIDELIYARDIGTFFGMVHDIIDKLTDEINEADTDKGIIRKALSIVEAEYANPDTNCNTIAYSLNVNSSYLSHVFKESTGEKLHFCINEYRIKKAEELMGAGYASLNDVARTVGFYNDAALIRIFKQHRGITPGEFRKLKEPCGPGLADRVMGKSS